MLDKRFYNSSLINSTQAFIDSGQFYWGTKKAWKKNKMIFSKNSSFVSLDGKKYRDINTLEDLRLAKQNKNVLLGQPMKIKQDYFEILRKIKEISKSKAIS